MSGFCCRATPLLNWLCTADLVSFHGSYCNVWLHPEPPAAATPPQVPPPPVPPPQVPPFRSSSHCGLTLAVWLDPLQGVGSNAEQQEERQRPRAPVGNGPVPEVALDAARRGHGAGDGPRVHRQMDANALHHGGQEPEGGVRLLLHPLRLAAARCTERLGPHHQQEPLTKGALAVGHCPGGHVRPGQVGRLELEDGRGDCSASKGPRWLDPVVAATFAAFAACAALAVAALAAGAACALLAAGAACTALAAACAALAGGATCGADIADGVVGRFFRPRPPWAAAHPI